MDSYKARLANLVGAWVRFEQTEDDVRLLATR